MNIWNIIVGEGWKGDVYMRRKKLLIAIVGLVILLIILLEFGLVDLHFYKSFIGSNEATWSTINKTSHLLRKDGHFTEVEYDDDNIFSYHIIIKDKDKILYKQNVIAMDADNRINIIAEFKEVNYSGNYILPMFKKYNMKYYCKINAVGKQSKKIDNGLDKIKKISIDAEVKGEIKAKVIGVCSVRKAKDIVYDNAIEYIKKYILNQLNKK